MQTPSNHLRGTGCPKCHGFKVKRTLEQFMEDARKIHGNKYDYSESGYVSSNSKIKIICPKHGEFMQTPNSHIDGAGCPECRLEKISVEVSPQMKNILDRLSGYYSSENDTQLAKCLKVPKSTFATWKKKDDTLALKSKCVELGIYEEIFNVQTKKVNIKNNLIFSDYTLKLVEAAVLKEGEENFQSHLLNLLQKTNIEPNKTKGGIKAKTNQQFIQDAKKVHGDKYDYSEVIYINNRSKIKIICPSHGEFFQTPGNHLNGSGCPICYRFQAKKHQINL